MIYLLYLIEAYLIFNVLYILIFSLLGLQKSTKHMVNEGGQNENKQNYNMVYILLRKKESTQFI